MERCSRCILPLDYPGLETDTNGTCNFCHEFEPGQYQGAEKLKADILKRSKGSKYDVAIGFSGGRDSSFLVYYLSRVLGLKVLAITIDNGYMSRDAIDNVRNIADEFGVELVIRKHGYLEYSFPRNLKAWSRQPDPALIIALCNGCRFGLRKTLYQVMQEYGARVLVDGASPLEPNPFKEKLFRLNPNGKGKLSLVIGILSHLLRNPRWIINPYNMYIFFMEYAAFYGKHYDKKLQQQGISLISPFYNYIHWDEKFIEETLKNDAHWTLSTQGVSTWRSDCLLAFLKGYLHKHTLGYNEQSGLISNLIRDGQISREEALARVTRVQSVPEEYIRELLEKTGVDFNSMVDTIKKNRLYREAAD